MIIVVCSGPVDFKLSINCFKQVFKKLSSFKSGTGGRSEMRGCVCVCVCAVRNRFSLVARK